MKSEVACQEMVLEPAGSTTVKARSTVARVRLPTRFHPGVASSVTVIDAIFFLP